MPWGWPRCSPRPPGLRWQVGLLPPRPQRRFEFASIFLLFGEVCASGAHGPACPPLALPPAETWMLVFAKFDGAVVRIVGPMTAATCPMVGPAKARSPGVNAGGVHAGKPAG